MDEIEAGIEGVTVRRVADPPAEPEGAVRVGPHSVARPGRLLRVVPGVGRFLARDGTTLEYWLEPDADPRAARAMLQGGVMGALIHQRGELPLHATTLLPPHRRFAVALAGHSGAGKSTTAYELLRRGWTLISDDLTRCTIEEGRATAWPGRSRLRLLADACDRFGLDREALEPAPNWPGKHLVEAPRWNEPARLAAMVVLQRDPGPFGIALMRGADAARALIEQTYRLHYVQALGRSRRHLELVAGTARGAAIFRTRGAAAVDAVADGIVSEVERIDAAPPPCDQGATLDLSEDGAKA